MKVFVPNPIFREGTGELINPPYPFIPNPYPEDTVLNPALLLL